MEKLETLSESNLPFLAGTDIGRRLKPEELRRLLPFLEVRNVREGSCLIREGARGDAWYVVLEGEVSVSKSLAHGPPHELATLGEGECFGELALIDGSPRLASIHALTDVRVARLAAEAFQRLIDQDSRLAIQLVLAMGAVVAQRQRELTYILTDLVEVGDPETEPDPEALAAMLRSALP